MNGETPIEILKKELDKQTNNFKKDRERHKRNALHVKLAIAMIAACATILLGWENPSLAPWFKNFALVLNALITVVAAYEVFYEPRKLWVRETIVFSKLKDLDRALNFELAQTPELANDRIEYYHQEITKILQESLKDWVQDKRNE